MRLIPASKKGPPQWVPAPLSILRPPLPASSRASLLNHVISILRLSTSKLSSSLSARSRCSSTLLSFPLPPNRDTSEGTGANLLASPQLISAGRPSFDSSLLRVAASPVLLVYLTAHFVPPSPSFSRLLCLLFCIRAGFALRLSRHFK